MGSRQHGLVVVGYGAESIVQADDGSLHRCVIRRRTGRPVCGDRVEWTQGAGKSGTIEQILPRHNELARTNYRGQARILAANLDCLMIVLAPQPAPDRELIDRYLVLAHSLRMDPLLVINKHDLLAASERSGLESGMLAPWVNLDYSCVWTSTKTDTGLDSLKQWLGDRVGILVGQSGVGKSSLINALLPERNARTQALSEASGQGRHTTTETTLYPLQDQGALVDSPGIRILRLGHLSSEIIANGYRDFHPYRDHCQYRNCTHRNEPDCAVREAVDKGRIHPLRFASYHALLAEIPN
ncbi:MAG: ribosome small subunit-dependent GTPase A [Aquisalimonadaceae bacterium]